MSSDSLPDFAEPMDVEPVPAQPVTVPPVPAQPVPPVQQPPPVQPPQADTVLYVGATSKVIKKEGFAWYPNQVVDYDGLPELVNSDLIMECPLVDIKMQKIVILKLQVLPSYLTIFTLSMELLNKSVFNKYFNKH